jgi:hypothetical protein
LPEVAILCVEELRAAVRGRFARPGAAVVLRAFVEDRR